MSVDPRFDGPGPDAVYAQNLAEGRFTIQQCEVCAQHQFPPALMCRSCGASSPTFVEASGRGTVYSATVVRAKEGARNVAIVQLREGPRLMSNVREIEPETIAIGMDVTAFIVNDHKAGEERHFVVFRPADGGHDARDWT